MKMDAKRKAGLEARLMSLRGELADLSAELSNYCDDDCSRASDYVTEAERSIETARSWMEEA